MCLAPLIGALAGHLAHLAVVVRGELQFARIDEAAFDERPCFPRALADIVRVEEAVVAAQVLIEIPPSAGGDLPEVGRCDLDDLPADLVADAEDLAKNEHQPLAPVQTKERAHRAADLCLLYQYFHRNRHRAGIGRIEVGNAPQPGGSVGERADRLGRGPLLLSNIQQVIRRNAV